MASWTDEQLKAITTRDKTLLISAAAGSGKTAVLIERIISLLTDPEDPMDISRLLIVTFTRAAASELRQRISKALSRAIAEDPQNKKLFKQLAALGSAHISTIDSFYADVIKKYSAKIGIPSSLRIADESELSPLRRSIMNDVLDMGYDGAFDDIEELKNVSFPHYKNATPFTAFADSISDMRSDSRTWETLIAIRQKLLSHQRGNEFILDCALEYDKATSSDLFDTPYGKVIKEHLTDSVSVMVSFLDDACEYLSDDDDMAKKYLPAFSHDLNFCKGLLSDLESKTYFEVRETILSYSAQKLGSLSADKKTPECEKYSEFRKKFVKEKIDSLKKTYFQTDCSSEAIMDYSARLAVICRVLYAVLSKFEELYSMEKLNRGMCEFSDIKQWAYKLLVNEDSSPTEIALEISDNFDAIYIDEYQDVDPVQDLIFKAVSKPRGRFMVGDVKQSIYGFRGSDPSLFMDYRSSFASIDPLADQLPDDDDCTIFMSSNFRCDESVINFANAVCSYIFKTSRGSIDYTDGDDLVFAKNRIDGYAPIAPPSPVTVALIDRTESDIDSDEEFSNLEAAYIAAEINRLIKSEVKSNGEKIVAGDIAVFSRAEKFLSLVSKELDKFNIAHSGGKGKSIFDDPEVMVVISLLHAIDNPHKDIYMAGTLISPIFGFTADEVIKLRSVDTKCSLYDALCKYAEASTDSIAQKCLMVKNSLNDLRSRAASMSADKIIRLVFSEFSLLSRRNSEKDSRKALLSLYENARQYVGSEFKGLYSYLCHVRDMIDGKTSPSMDSSTADAVQLMSIHKSKGLEFPVCFVASTSSKFNTDDTKKVVLYSPKLGISANIFDADGFGKITTPYQSALSREIINSGTEEEMRLLYVALTRARERLYVSASPLGKPQNLENAAEFNARYSSRGTVMSTNNYISWILSALYFRNEDFFNIVKVNSDEIAKMGEALEKSDKANTPVVEYGEDVFETVKKNFEFEYPYLHVSNIPAKLSVSKLTPGVLDRSSDEGEDNSLSDTIDLSMPEIYTPSFMSDGEEKAVFTAAEKGTATHTFLQFCDFDRTKATGVKNEISRLVRDKFIDLRTANAINEKQIEKFFESNLFAEISSAKRLWREQRFNILLPASAFTEDKEYGEKIKDEKLLVQGVIDLFFENDKGELILCDYKTDYLSNDEIRDPSLAQKKLNDAHARQLSYYAEALASMFGKYPDRVLIYSLPLGDTVDIKTEPILK